MSEDKNVKERETISIRGVNRDLYHRLGLFAKETGITIGEAVNNAMAAFLGTIEEIKTSGKELIEGLQKGMNMYIGDIEELTVEREDLENVDTSIVLRNIKKLEFSEDIDQELFNKKIRRIINIEELIIPEKLSKFQVLAKGFGIKKLTVKRI